MTMADRPDVAELVNAIKKIPSLGGTDFQAALERALERELRDVPITERLALLEEVAGRFGGPAAAPPAVPAIPPAQFAKLVSLLLGKGVVASELSPEDMSARLVKTLNTVFDTLNQIIGVINSTLMGREGEQETIRHLISSEVKGETAGASLQGYLDQIQEAFLVAHNASSLAAEAVLAQVLGELDPNKLAAAAEGRLKFGVLRRAELFEVYQERFAACRKAFESGRLMEGFLREFEKACTSLYKKNARRRT
jgi:hypothetical protein